MKLTIPKAELANYAKETLGAIYLFWSIQEPYFSENVIPFFSKEAGGKQRR